MGPKPLGPACGHLHPLVTLHEHHRHDRFNLPRPHLGPSSGPAALDRHLAWHHPAEAPAIGEALVNSGFAIIEVPLNSPEPLQSITTLTRQFPQILIGAGTVLNVQQVKEVHAAGGRLVVAPNFNPARGGACLGAEHGGAARCGHAHRSLCRTRCGVHTASNFSRLR